MVKIQIPIPENSVNSAITDWLNNHTNEWGARLGIAGYTIDIEFWADGDEENISLLFILMFGGKIIKD